MNQLQEQIIANTNDMPRKFVQEIADFSEFLKRKLQSQAARKRVEQSEKDIKDGRVATVTPQELFKELDI